MINKKSATFFLKEASLLFSGYYSSFKKTIFLLILNHWLFLFLILALITWNSFDAYILESSLKKDLYVEFSKTLKTTLKILILLTFAIKAIGPLAIFKQPVNITDKFKRYIWLELIINPFGLIFCLYKLSISNVFVWKRKKEYCFASFWKKMQYKHFLPTTGKNYLLDINNLSYIYHGDKGISKVTHFLMKKISPKLYKKHMCSENKKDEMDPLSEKYNDFSVLKNIDLNFVQGKFITIFGANGSGKSTLIKVINNLIQDYEGEVFWMGKNAKDISVKSFAQNVSYVAQHSLIYASITLYDFVLNGLFPKQTFFDKEKVKNLKRVEEILTVFGIIEYKNKFLSTLSGGIKQKSIIARALVQDTKIIILDEPTTYLDINNQYLILSIFKKIQEERNITVFAILHDYQQTKRYSDEVILLDKGMVFAYGKTKNVLIEKNLKQILE